jgi:serine/threonine protein kinase
MNPPAESLGTVPEQEGQPIPDELPSHIGRYRVERLLDEGGFGRVYLAYDDQLLRLVAIKVPEARMVASLDHPNIVPVHDVGTWRGPCLPKIHKPPALMRTP